MRPTDTEYCIKGSYSHNPMEIHEIARDAWQSIYKGKEGDLSHGAKQICNKYKEFIRSKRSHTLPRLTMQQRKDACINAGPTAAGLDHWKPTEFGQFSDNAYAMVALLFNTIEEGAKWPKDITLARSAFMSKSSDTYEDLLNYRVLTILPVPYRRWATASLHSLKPWIDDWDMPEIFAGGIGKGAQDGWYSTAAQLENFQLHKVWYAGGAVDIRKCVDQMPRSVIYSVGRHLPTSTQYREVWVMHTKKRCGIPQAIYLKPWGMAMKGISIYIYIYIYNVQVRRLSDSMLILASGPTHLQDFENTLDATHEYLEEIGSFIAPEKSANFTNDGEAAK